MEEHSMENENGNNSFLAGLLTGCAIGITMGILFAPHSGSETRAMLVDKTEEARKSASKMILDAEKKAAEIIAKARETAADLMQKEGERIRPKPIKE
jgi:gas vesicle protein